MGAVTSYFGNDEWSRYTFGLKSLVDAENIRRHILLEFERAEALPPAQNTPHPITIVIVGGGPTGVEMAGAVAELTRSVLKKDFRRIHPEQTRVVLIEASPTLLGHFPASRQDNARASLEQLGVEVRVASPVKEITAGKVVLANETIDAQTIIWAAAVQAPPVTATLGVDLDRAGRIKVLADCSVPGYPEVFAIGDINSLIDARAKPVPGVSPGAQQEGQHVARLISQDIAGQTPRAPSQRAPFRYRDNGSMATIGRYKAVATIGPLKLTGLPAWQGWLLVHLVFLLGLRNKASVLLQWSYACLRNQRGARIILGTDDSTKP